MTTFFVGLLTFVAGLLTFLVGQYMLVLVFLPIGRVRRILADIASAVLFRQSLITNGTIDNEFAKELKLLGANLRATSAEVLFYSFWADIKIFSIPSEKQLLIGARELNVLYHNLSDTRDPKSPSTCAEENTMSLIKLEKELGVYTTYSS